MVQQVICVYEKLWEQNAACSEEYNMLGIIYLLLAGFLGYKTADGLLVQKKNQWKWKGSRIWLILPVSFGVGTLLITWAVYVVSWMASVCAGIRNPLLYSNLAVMTSVSIWAVLDIVRMSKKQRISSGEIFWGNRAELAVFGILLVFLTYMMFYVFFIKNGGLVGGILFMCLYAFVVVCIFQKVKIS